MDTEPTQGSLERVIRCYSHSVQSLAFTYLKNRSDAEDVAQDVFLAYLSKAPHFANDQKEKAWLMTVTVNRCKTLLRSAWRKDLPLPEDLSYLPKEESDVLQAVLSLEKKYRLSIYLHYYEGYTLSEIGGILHCSPMTVGSWLSRGREKLKSILGEEFSA